MKYKTLTSKKQKLEPLKLSAAQQKELDDLFTLELTYHSIALSGNTLSCEETAAVIGTTIPSLKAKRLKKIKDLVTEKNG